jgi:hypothetical protein
MLTAMKALSDTPDRLVLGKANIVGGLVCLGMTPLVAFLGVMMIRDEPAAFGWASIGLSVVMVGLGVAAMRSRLRITLDAAEDLVEVSHIKPWGRTDHEAVLSHFDGVELHRNPDMPASLVEVVLTPVDGDTTPRFRIGQFNSDAFAENLRKPVADWLEVAKQKS